MTADPSKIKFTTADPLMDEILEERVEMYRLAWEFSENGHG